MKFGIELLAVLLGQSAKELLVLFPFGTSKLFKIRPYAF
jgi:hypothetical protein